MPILVWRAYDVTAQKLALPPQKQVRAGLCPEARGHGFSNSMSPSKATHATILALPVTQGAPACSALLKEGTKPLQTPIVGHLRASSTAGTPTAWLPRQCPGWQWSPACQWSAAACTRGGHNQPGRQHCNITAARLPACRSLEGTGVSPAQCMAPTGGMWGSRSLVPGDASFSCTQHRDARTVCTSPGATRSSHSPQGTRNPSLPRVSNEQAKPPKHRDSLAGATLLLSVMKTLVPLPCLQLPPALPCRQSVGPACPGQAPASQPEGRCPAEMEKVFRKHAPTPAAPRLRFVSPQPYLAPLPCPVQPPPAVAPPRPARGAASSRHPQRRGPTLRDRQGRVSRSRRTAPSSPEAPGRSSARSPGHREGGCAWKGSRARGSLGRNGKGARRVGNTQSGCREPDLSSQRQPGQGARGD